MRFGWGRTSKSCEAFTQGRTRVSVQQAVMVSAAHTRLAQDTKVTARYEALTLPAVQVYPSEVDGRALVQQDLWPLHLQDFYVWQRAQEHLLSELPRTKRTVVEQRVLERYQAAVYQAYGWEPSTTRYAVLAPDPDQA